MESVDGLEERVKGGKFVDKDGNVVGEHKGYPFYTIGQRRGLHLSMGRPVYVTHIDAENNVITVGDKEDLISTTCLARELNMVKYDEVPDGEMEIVGKIDRKSTRLNSSHVAISYAVFCLKKKKKQTC